ncbi:MAG: hypothetical protein FWC03_00100 [Treponema sp.]|nr:hypothetical protein [Treponema sp.]
MAGNYLSDIHNTNYEDDYLKIKLNSDNLINITGRETESLNGRWNFGADWYDTCRRAKWFKEIRSNHEGELQPLDWDWEAWDRIKVPAAWNTERKELSYFEGSGIYTRTFRYIRRRKDERLFLRFEGSAYRTSVFLNKTFIGTHDGASTPFNVDISDIAEIDNRIVITVDARRSPERIPMDNTDWYNYGGIYRDVLLVRTPKIHIKDWFIRLAPDSGYSKIRADISVSGKEDEDITGTVRLTIKELNIDADIPVVNGTARSDITVKENMLNLWSPENPKLYDAAIYFGDDIVFDRIGFREIRVSGHEILLNGKKIFLKGICVHEDHHLLGKNTNEDVIRSTIRDLKELNGNYLRLAHYPHDMRFARIADEEGVLLWEEIPVYWAVAFNNPDTYADAENQLSELVLRDRNRASVILWSVGNENADTEDRYAFMSNLVKKARELDDSRLVSAACLLDHKELVIRDRLADNLDVIGINEYYGWYDPDFEKLPKILSNSNPGKPVLICEFGACARSGQRGTEHDLFTEDKQKKLYEQQIAVFRKCKFIAGITPWILYDFRCPRRLHRYQEGYNRKGLIDADRKTRKLAFYTLQNFYKEI